MSVGRRAGGGETYAVPMLHNQRSIAVERAEKFVSETYFTDVNLRGQLYVPMRPAKVGDSFGPSWVSYWFRVELTLPAEWAGAEAHFLWNSNNEALMFNLEGEPIQAFTGGDGDDRRHEYVLCRSVPAGGQRMAFFVEMACNGMFGVGEHAIGPPDANRTFVLKQVEVARLNRGAWDIYWDFVVLTDMAKCLFAANRFVNVCQPLDPTTYAAARAVANGILQQRNGDHAYELSAIGHCHIDTAWLWPYAETRRKCARSFATQLLLFEEYPWHKFVCSQAQQYAWVQQDYPNLFERIKRRVATGHFVPTGGTWVEMDANMPCGESFVRQFLVGQRYFRDTFGAYCTEFWLPDTFGYAAQLPQIIRGAGMNAFLTQKLSWNLINKMPHNSFFWEGLDGTRVLTHFPPADTYNAHANVRDVHASEKNNRDRDRTNDALMLFGHGDGGGGPTRPMLEQLARMRNVAGLPRVEMRTPREFFDRLRQYSDVLPTWKGELFFELHQGTFTSQAATKRGNRKSELLLRDAELWSVMASVAMREPMEYPRARLLEAWKLVLLNQFHDVLPGSSIGAVYEDALRYYETVQGECASVIAAACSHVIAEIADMTGVVEPLPDDKLAVFNSMACELICVPASWPTAQRSAEGEGLALVTVPPMGFTIVDRESLASQPDIEPVKVVQLGAGGSVSMENRFLSVTFNSSGQIVSLLDKRNMREVVQPGARCNEFVMYDDMPFFWDAWDVLEFSEEKKRRIAGGRVTIVEQPLRGCIRLVLQISEASSLVQLISLDCNSPILEFYNEVDWHENRQLLRVEFPVHVHAHSASYEVQYGIVQRPTHNNTTWDVAKFEVCAQRWADLSEFGYGVALLNDCKYGNSVRDSTLRLSLLRAPKEPDDKCDMGTHVFRYGLYPHVGTLQESGVVRAGLAFNTPLRAAACRSLHAAASSVAPGAAAVSLAQVSSFSLFTLAPSSVVLDWVKMSEDREGVVVARVYEAFGGRAQCLLKSAVAVARVERCDLLERPLAAGGGDAGVSTFQSMADDVVLLGADGHSVQFTVQPFQVVTLKLFTA